MPRSLRLVVAALIGVALAVATQPVVLACTAFCAIGADGQVLVGNNEDWFDPRTKLHFIPASPGAYGRMYTGFDDGWPQGGMNEKGLWFDGFAAPPVKASGSAQLPGYPGNIVDAAMAQCATVEEVVRLFSGYNRSFLSEGILMFADASGDAVSIEPNAIVRKPRDRARFVQTNFHQSRGIAGPGLDRYQTASAMLERAGADISVDLFRRILAATHQEGGGPTQYSNVYDLTSRTMTLYYFHDFNRAVTFRLDDELKKGDRVLDIPSLFPRNAAADAFAASRPQQGSGSPAPAIALVALLGMVIVGAVAGVVRGDRRVRIGFGVVAACIVVPIALVLAAVHLRTHGPKSPQWIQFTLAPATGESAQVNPTTLRGDGPTLRRMIAEAYGFPAVRVIGPSWLSETRYTVNATVGADDERDFRELLREELDRHLHLQSHVEVRPYDAFLLQATGEPRLPRAPGQSPSIFINKGRVEFHNASMAHITDALQAILGKPVMDKTGLSERYDFELSWQSPPLEPVTAALRDRFGLDLTPARVEMETLVIDHARRDPALFLLAQAGRVTRFAPLFVRDGVRSLLTID